MILEIILFAAILGVDLVTKHICSVWLAPLQGSRFAIWDGVISLKYVRNTGAAFSILQGKQTFFIVLTVVLCVGMSWFIIHERKRMPRMMRIAMVMIVAGAIGNLADRIFLGYVRDMIYFELINFAIFNVADAAITVGAVILFIDVLFCSGGKYLAEMDKKNKKTQSDEKDGQ